MHFVIDCSTTMPWLLRNDDTGYADRVLRSLEHGSAIAPELWFLEVTNVLLVFERRRRIRREESARFTSLLQELPIDPDEGLAFRAFSKIMDLARRYALSAYDATYLELAARENLPLATLDKALRAAAKKAGVDVWQPV